MGFICRLLASPQPIEFAAGIKQIFHRDGRLLAVISEAWKRPRRYAPSQLRCRSEKCRTRPASSRARRTRRNKSAPGRIRPPQKPGMQLSSSLRQFRAYRVDRTILRAPFESKYQFTQPAVYNVFQWDYERPVWTWSTAMRG
jgi:hypothetical protein